MTNPEQCPKCGAGVKSDSGKHGALYECGRWLYPDGSGYVDEIHTSDAICYQRQLDQQREEMEKRFESVSFDGVEPIRGSVIALAEQLQSLAERVKVLEKGGEHE